MMHQPRARASLQADLGRGETVELAAQPPARRTQVRAPDAHHPYFVDFVCRERKVIVEVDGGTHSTDEEVAHDARRTRHLQSLGYRAFRVSNDDIYHNLDCILDALLAFIEAPR